MTAWAHGWYGYAPHMGLEVWGWLWPFLWLGLLVLGVYLVARALTRRERTDRALEILRERYARGELDKETFERMKRDLAEAPVWARSSSTWTPPPRARSPGGS